MEQDFEICYEIDRLGKEISDGIYKVNIKNKEKYIPEKPSNKQATNAALFLCNKWNQNIKSRNFIKTLIREFMKFSWKNKIDIFESKEDAYCDILKTSLIGKDEFIDIIKRFKKLQQMIDMQENDQLRAQKVDKVADWVDDMKRNKNFTNPHFGYYFGNFNGFICIDAYFGIKAFIEWAQTYGVQDVINIVNQAYKKEVKKIQKPNTFANNINPEGINKLNQLRQLKRKENMEKMKNK